MAVAKTVTVYECDGCGFMVKAESNSKPKGFYGTVQEIHPDGNSKDAEWYAHSDRCIKQAVIKIVELNS